MKGYNDVDALLEDYYRRQRWLNPRPWWDVGRYTAIFWVGAVVVLSLVAMGILYATR